MEKNNSRAKTEFEKRLDMELTFLIKSEDRRVRNVANSVKGKYRTALSVVQNCYPFQTDEGVLCAKRRMKDGTSIWVEKRLNAASARVVVNESIRNFYKYIGSPEIKRVVVGAPVEK